MKVTINRDARSTFAAVCWYAKQKSIDCDDCMVEMLGDTVSLTINTFVKIDELTITLVSIGVPVSAMEYRGDPKIYKELVIDGPNESDIVSFIKEANVAYDIKCKQFDKSETHILVLTWDGSWCDEYKTPKRSNKSIYLPDDSYQKVLTDLKSFYANSERYAQLEVPYVRTYMLHGLPGTGKTSMIYTIATELDKNIAILDFSDKDMSDTSIRRAVYKLPANPILCLEDMDSLFAADRKSDKSTITFSGVLNVLDGVIKNTGLVIFMTTNLLANMDDTAMKRRVDYYLKFDLMKKDQIVNMFTHFFPNQNSKKFSELCTKLQLTPCILKKFFVRNLMSESIESHIDELRDMCEHDYKIINTSSIYT